MKYLRYAIHRPPDRTILAEYNVAWFDSAVSQYRPTDQIILVGDFNIVHFQLDDHGHIFVENLKPFSFLPVISKPTHVSNN